ncbi:hypothetical protein SALBM311S_11701 [Streptomyces alboniger]
MLPRGALASRAARLKVRSFRWSVVPYRLEATAELLVNSLPVLVFRDNKVFGQLVSDPSNRLGQDHRVQVVPHSGAQRLHLRPGTGAKKMGNLTNLHAETIRASSVLP